MQIEGVVMHTIVIAGAHRAVGKTTLGRKLRSTLEGRTELVKVGHGRDKEKEELLLHSPEEAVRLLADRRRQGNLDYLIIESNAVLRSFSPDFCIFIESCGPQGQSARDLQPKKSAQYAREHADLIVDKASDLSSIVKQLPSYFRFR
jgi:hypothetical protein